MSTRTYTLTVEISGPRTEVNGPIILDMLETMRRQIERHMGVLPVETSVVEHNAS